MLKVNRILIGSVAVLFLAVSAHSDDRSIWQKVVDFFSPTPAVTCDGPVCDELRNLDSKLGKVEGRYTRERRPVHKERLKKEMDSLQVVRDSLLAVIESQPKADSTAQADKKSVDVAPVKSAEKTESKQMNICAHDTVFVHDTVVVHDTLYVVLANKPEPVAPAAPETSEASAAEPAVPAATTQTESSAQESAAK